MEQPFKLVAKIRLRSAARTQWLKSALCLPDPTRYHQAGFGTLPNLDLGTLRIRDALDGLQRDARARVKLTYARSPIVIEGMVGPKAMVQHWPILVGMFLQAAEVGAVGEILATNRKRFGMRIVLAEASPPLLECFDPVAARAQKRGPIQLPGVLERAPTGRSTCRACREPIGRGTVRFGVVDVSRGVTPKPTYRWLHPTCAARTLPDTLGPVIRDTELDFPDRVALVKGLSPSALNGPRIDIFERETMVRSSDGRTGVVVWYGLGKFDRRIRVGVRFHGADAPEFLSPEVLEKV